MIAIEFVGVTSIGSLLDGFLAEGGAVDEEVGSPFG